MVQEKYTEQTKKHQNHTVKMSVIMDVGKLIESKIIS